MDRSTLENKIRVAFRGVVLGQGISLRQAQIADCYGDEAQDGSFEHLPPDEPKDDWTRVRVRDDNSDCIAHLDAEGLRYYLPALMQSVITDYDAGSMRVIGTLSALDPRGAYGDRRLEILNGEQRQAIACFLKALPELVTLSDRDAKVVSRSLSAYWKQFFNC
jgi:hypothetical protein